MNALEFESMHAVQIALCNMHSESRSVLSASYSVTVQYEVKTGVISYSGHYAVWSICRVWHSGHSAVWSIHRVIYSGHSVVWSTYMRSIISWAQCSIKYLWSIILYSMHSAVWSMHGVLSKMDKELFYSCVTISSPRYRGVCERNSVRKMCLKPNQKFK